MKLKYQFKDGIMTDIDSDEYNELRQDAFDRINGTLNYADVVIKEMDDRIQIIVGLIDDLAKSNYTVFKWAEDAAIFNPELIAEYRRLIKLKNVLALELVKNYVDDALKPLSKLDVENMVSQMKEAASDFHELNKK